MAWTERNSKDFIDFGDVFTPYRVHQSEILVKLLKGLKQPKKIVDICCGEGLWSKKILEEIPDSVVYGLDISDEMLMKASKNLSVFGKRFIPKKFDLFAADFSQEFENTDAFVSSLSIHHLDSKGKMRLYDNLYKLLNEDGALLIFDVIQPTTYLGFQLAATQWDSYVTQYSKKTNRVEALDKFINEKWNCFRYPSSNPDDTPSTLSEHLNWLEKANFGNVDIYWMYAGHAFYGGYKIKAM